MAASKWKEQLRRAYELGKRRGFREGYKKGFKDGLDWINILSLYQKR